MTRQRAKERQYENDILNTISYRSLFRYPVTKYQLFSCLITQDKSDFSFFEKTLNRLVKSGSVGCKDGLFYSKKIKPISRTVRVKNTKEILQFYKRVFNILSLVPWVKLICVTGSVAAYNTERDSDIDIFIVSQKDRLFITRGVCSVLMKVLNVYSTGGKEPKKICPNLYIDTSDLTWKKQSVYTAHEIILMQPVVNKEQTYEKFLLANKWVCGYFANFTFPVFTAYKNAESESYLFKWLEILAKKLQLSFMRNKRTSEVIEDNIIHFNKNDNSLKILDKYQKLAK